MDFPRLVFKDGGKHPRAGGTYSTELAQDQDEYDALLASGWSATLPEAIAPKLLPDDDDDKAAATHEEIVAKLTDMGVIFDRRLGTKKLLALLEEKLKG